MTKALAVGPQSQVGSQGRHRAALIEGLRNDLLLDGCRHASVGVVGGRGKFKLAKPAHQQAGLFQSVSQALLPLLSAWVEVGGIASSLCLTALLLQPISI